MKIILNADAFYLFFKNYDIIILQFYKSIGLENLLIRCKHDFTLAMLRR